MSFIFFLLYFFLLFFFSHFLSELISTTNNFYSSIPENIPNLVNEGALDALIKLAHGDDTTVAHNCVVTLCNISADPSAAQRVVRGTAGSAGTPLDAIIALSHSESEDVRIVCLLALFRLSQVPGLEGIMVSSNVVPALMRLRHDSGSCGLMMARTVFNLANVREIYLRIEKVIQAAVTVASSSTLIEQMLCCAKTFKTLGNKIELRPRLLEEGVMSATTTILIKCASASQEISVDADDQQQILMLTRLSCSILHDLAACPRNRLAMVREKIVGTVVALASVPNQDDRVRGICAGIISELAQSEGNQVQVINQGLGVLLKLADSNDRRTRAMCAETLCELSRSRRGCPRVVKAGGIELLTNLLARDGDNKMLRKKVAEALCNLMKPEFTSEESLKEALPSVVGLVKYGAGSGHQLDRLTGTAAIRIVFGMSRESWMCHTLAECGAMEVLLPLARTGVTNIAVQMRCIAAVCNISRGTASSTSAQRLAEAGAVGIFLGCVKQSVGDAEGGAGIPGRAVVDSVAALCGLAENPVCAEQIVQQGLHSLIKLAEYGTLLKSQSGEEEEEEEEGGERAVNRTGGEKERKVNTGYWSSKAREWCSVILCRLSENEKTRKGQVLKGVCSAIIGIASNLTIPGAVSSNTGGGNQHAQEDVAQRCAAALNNYSLDSSSVARLVEDGVIEVLLKLATSYSEQCRENCARALCNICAGEGMEHVVVKTTTAVPELMVMALVRSESIVTKQICAVSLMNVLVPETIAKMLSYGIVWAMSSLSHQSQQYAHAHGASHHEGRRGINGSGGGGGGSDSGSGSGSELKRSRSSSLADLMAEAEGMGSVDNSPKKSVHHSLPSSETKSKQKKTLDAVRAVTKFVHPRVQHSLVNACATGFLNLSCTPEGRQKILADAGALQAVFHFLLGGSGGAAHHVDRGESEYVNHCQKLSWDICWNLLQDPSNHVTLVLNDFLRTVETLAVTARSDVESFNTTTGGGHGSKGGSLDMDDHILREIFNLIDSDGSNTLDKYELLEAVNSNQQVLELVHSAPILAPLLQPDAFEKAIMELDTAHSGIVTFSEFKAFLITQTRKIEREMQENGGIISRTKENSKGNSSKGNSSKGNSSNGNSSNGNGSRGNSSRGERNKRTRGEESRSSTPPDSDYSGDYSDEFDDEDQREFEGGDVDGSPTVSSMLAVMSEQRRHAETVGTEAAARHTARTLRNVAVAMRRLSCNDEICSSIIERNGISILVAACRSTELKTKTMCARVLCTLARHHETRTTIVAEGAMAALELISMVPEPSVLCLVATTLRLLSWHTPNAVIMTQQGFLEIASKILKLAGERREDISLRAAVFDVAATVETISWVGPASEVMAHSNGTMVVGALLKYDCDSLCRSAVVALCNMASCGGVHQMMVEEGAVGIHVHVCEKVLFSKVSSNVHQRSIIVELRHRVTLMLAYLANGLTGRKARGRMVKEGVIPYVLRLASAKTTSLATKEVCSSVLAALSHAPNTRTLMIEQGALAAVTELADCGSEGARLNCTTAMSKLSASVVQLQAGTVTSLISLCMAPPKPGSIQHHHHHKGGSTGGGSPGGRSGGRSGGKEGGKEGEEDLMAVDSTVLPAPPPPTSSDQEEESRSKEMGEPNDVGGEEKLPDIFPVKWKKQNIHEDGVAPEAPQSGAETGTGSLESEAQAIEANLATKEETQEEEEGGCLFFFF